MSASKTALLCFFCLLSAHLLHAQTPRDTVQVYITPSQTTAAHPAPAKDWRSLPIEEKLKLLEYMRTLGGDIDQEIQQMFARLDSASQLKTNLYVQSRHRSEGDAMRTYVRWSRDTVHVGKITEGSFYLDSVLVTNIGTQPYEIGNIKTSCDCTVIRHPTFPLMPGETAVVRLEFDSRTKQGAFLGGIVIYDNSRPNSRSILYMDGEVVPKQ